MQAEDLSEAKQKLMRQIVEQMLLLQEHLDATEAEYGALHVLSKWEQERMKERRAAK